jgi:hypothetical protein
MASSDDFDDGLDFDTQVEVTIDKKNNPHVIGLRLRNIRNFGLQITGIKRDGAVFAWNCENPSRQVREYDCIVDVNGTWGDPVGMFKLIQRVSVIRMVIRRTGSIEQQLRLQYRDLGPEDYDLLVALDARAPTLTNLPRAFVVSLPRIKAPHCVLNSCVICMHDFDEDEATTQLPCSHNFCTACIERWLTQEKASCPLCLAPVSASDGSGGRWKPSRDVSSEGLVAPQVSQEPPIVRPGVARRMSRRFSELRQRMCKPFTDRRNHGQAITGAFFIPYYGRVTTFTI